MSRSPTILAAVLGTPGLLSTAGMAAGGQTFFVSTEGDDGWSGLIPAPNEGRTDGPFSSLVRARDAVRSEAEAGLVTPNRRGGFLIVHVSSRRAGGGGDPGHVPAGGQALPERQNPGAGIPRPDRRTGGHERPTAPGDDLGQVPERLAKARVFRPGGP